MKIETNIPVPTNATVLSKKSRKKYYMELLNIGDSFVVEASASGVKASLLLFKRDNPGKEFVYSLAYRSVANKFRIWRVK